MALRGVVHGEVEDNVREVGTCVVHQEAASGTLRVAWQPILGVAVQGKGVVICSGAFADVEEIEGSPYDPQLPGASLSSPQISAASSDSSLDGSEGASFQGASVPGALAHPSLVPFPFLVLKDW